MSQSIFSEMGLFEFNILVVGGMFRAASALQVLLRLAEKIGFRDFECGPSPYGIWQKLYHDPFSIDVPELVCRENIDRGHWWIDIFQEEMPDVNTIHQDVLTHLRLRSANPLGTKKLDPKVLLARMSKMGLPNVPLTIPASGAMGDGWVYKQYWEEGGEGITLQRPENLTDWVAQREVKNDEEFIFPVEDEWRILSCRTDLRLYWWGQGATWKEFAGFFGRVAQPGQLVCNVASGGMVIAVFVTDDVAGSIQEWNERISRFEPDLIAHCVEEWDREYGIDDPLAYRPRFIPSDLVPWSAQWTQQAHDMLWRLNKELPPVSTWDQLVPWNKNSPPVFIGADFGMKFV